MANVKLQTNLQYSLKLAHPFVGLCFIICYFYRYFRILLYIFNKNTLHFSLDINIVNK